MGQEKDIGYNLISNFYKSFSGTDTLVFILMPGSNPVVLGSITTVAYSAYRTKQPVINLGRTNINGVTRGTRIFAGTMIFTMINQHWLNELAESESLKWLGQYDELKADELPLFDLMIISANEYGSYVSMFIYGVDVTDEAQVISVEDLFTENTLSFIARDIETFKAGNIVNPMRTYKSQEISNVKVDNFYVFENSALNQNDNKKRNVDIKEYDEIINTRYTNLKKEKLQAIEKLQKLNGFTRELEYNPHDMMVGDDVGFVQTKLRELDMLDSLTYMYDQSTENATRLFQSFANLNITGVVDSRTYIVLMNINNKAGERENITGIVINESGTRVFNIPNAYSNIIDTIPYNKIVQIYDKVDEVTFKNPVTNEIVSESGHSFYRLEQGYILVNDVYSYEYSNKDYAFPTINLYESGPYVTMLQDLLVSQYGVFDYTPGTYDQTTIDLVTKIQSENDIACILGVVNEETWRFLQSAAGNLITDITNNNVTVKASNPQGKYSLSSIDMNTDLFKGFDVKVSSNKKTSVTCCGIAYYNNGNTKTITKQYGTTNEAKEVLIDFTDFQNLFTYSIDDGFPYKIEYILNPFNGESYKWIIDYGGE